MAGKSHPEKLSRGESEARPLEAGTSVSPDVLTLGKLFKHYILHPMCTDDDEDDDGDNGDDDGDNNDVQMVM